ncbi:MAG: hypothetical protein F4X74_13580 [Acidimicrobiia bacterium]|nr:hypothetical protein [Acidimicrobiia bacterium]
MSLRNTLDNIRSSPVPSNEQEAITEILLIVQSLGWDPLRQVKQEHPVSGGRIDIALLGPERIVAFIEAKAPRVKLNRHVEQIVKYAFHEGVDICVLTNGLEWWLYLPMERRPFEDRRFATLEIRKDPISQLEERLGTFLGERSVLSSRALRAARDALEEERSADSLRKIVPETWRDMLAGPDAELVDLVRERVYETKGLRPTSDQVVAVIRRPFRPTHPPVPRPEPGPSPSPRGNIQFRLWGETYVVESWIRVLLTVLAQLHKQHGDTEFALRLGRRVSSRHDKFSRPVQVGSTGYFINRSIPVEEIQRRAHTWLKRFEHPSSDLVILSNLE